MNSNNLLNEILSLYQKHGWRPRRVLLTPASRSQIDSSNLGNELVISESEIDAIWFSRESQPGREAWELRLLSEQPYALFETFEADETEEDREERRQEMEATMRDKRRSSEC
jgi:hypothetical protein